MATHQTGATRALTIGIDFDGTFAADPVLFKAFVEGATRRGHRCVLVTQRTEFFRRDVDALCADVLPIVYAGGETKRDAAAARGWAVDIWIDDNPASVDTALIYVGR